MKDKYYVIFASKVNGIEQFIARKPVKLGKKDIKFKKGTYLLDFEQVIYRKGNKCYLIVDINDNQVVLGGNVSTLTPEFNDLHLARHSAKQFVTALQMGMGFNWFMILFLIFGIPIGLIIGWAIPITTITGGG